MICEVPSVGRGFLPQRAELLLVRALEVFVAAISEKSKDDGTVEP
jgi:hypothetical protein